MVKFFIVFLLFINTVQGQAVIVSDQVAGGVIVTSTADTINFTPMQSKPAIVSHQQETGTSVPTAVPSPAFTPASNTVGTQLSSAVLAPTGGQTIAFTSNMDGQWSIYTIHPDGTGLKRITRQDLSLNRWNYFAPALSPDLTQLLLVIKQNVHSYLFLKDLTTGKGKRISSSKDFDLDPAWSWDGQKMVFVSLREHNNPQIFSSPRRGWPTKQMTQGEWPCVHPTFSPDGQQVCFVSKRDGTDSLFITTFDGKDIKRLTSIGSSSFYPAWSPDGKTIAFVAIEGKKYQIFTIDPETGTQVVKLSDGRSSDKEPCFSPSGDEIVFDSDREGSDEIYIMDKNGKNRRRVTFNHASSWQPSWK